MDNIIHGSVYTLMAEEARFSKWLAQEAQLSQKHEEM